jgi:homoserine O-acetyltransferase
MNTRSLLIIFFVAVCVSKVLGQSSFPQVSEGDYIIENFHFEDGSSLAQLNIHYTTLGKPLKNENGKILNAILIMHGTTGSGHSFLNEKFAGNLFNPGQLLDATKYYIILPDGIGHGKSSKPSDGMQVNFPRYTYHDMVKAQYELVTAHLKVNHLRMVMGTSMGGMHSWIWGYTYPDFMDALMPLASAPVEIAGRNRMFRKAVINCIESDPQWKGGAYEKQPELGLACAASTAYLLMGANKTWHKMAPTGQVADSLLLAMIKRFVDRTDANDLIYQMDASRNYNPAPIISKIKAPLFAVNSADDEINPPELGIMEKEISKVKNGRYILLPITEETTGHGTHSNPKVWGDFLQELLELTNKN